MFLYLCLPAVLAVSFPATAPPRFLMQFVSGTHEGGEGERDRSLSEMRENQRERGGERALSANLGVNFIDAESASAA